MTCKILNTKNLCNLRNLWLKLICGIALALVIPAPAHAQSLGDIGFRGFAMAANMSFTASDSFEAVLDRSSGPIYGGGGQVLLPWDIFVEIGAWQFKQNGQRVFIGPNSEVFKLGIPVAVTVTPFEVTAGYRFTQVARRLIPYAGVGYSSYRYKETSQFAEPAENVDERFGGYHAQVGVEFHGWRWISVGGEASFSTIANALGEAGVSKHFNEDNLGGASVRLKISVGR
jgi:hypothetical protein